MRLIDKVLVTGGAGFIGSHVAGYYAKKAKEVIVLDNLSRTETLGTDQKAALHNWNYLKKTLSEEISKKKKDIQKLKTTLQNLTQPQPTIQTQQNILDPK